MRAGHDGDVSRRRIAVLIVDLGPQLQRFALIRYGNRIDRILAVAGCGYRKASPFEGGHRARIASRCLGATGKAMDAIQFLIDRRHLRGNLGQMTPPRIVGADERECSLATFPQMPCRDCGQPFQRFLPLGCNVRGGVTKLRGQGTNAGCKAD